jgi:hypothetical protein
MTFRSAAIDGGEVTLRVRSDRAARWAMLSIQRQMPAGENRRLTGQPKATKPITNTFLAHLAKRNQSGILPVHGAER